MKKTLSIALMMAMALTGTIGLTACSSEEEINENVVYDTNGNAGVNSEFVISIPRTVLHTTRMSEGITQNKGVVDQFRGIDNIRLFAFDEEPTASSQKNSDMLQLEAITGLSKPGSINYKVYTNKFVPVGTTHFLFYGKAIYGTTPDKAAEEAERTISSMDDKFHYGVLNYTGLTNESFVNPNSITFSLEQINTSTAEQIGNTTGQAIVQLLNNLANITVTSTSVAAPNNKWSTTTNFTLATLYKNFLTLTTASSESLSAILSRLYFSADHVLDTDPARPLANAIRTMINDACTNLTEGKKATLKSQYSGYPTALGLPDGAARVRWNQSTSKFVDITADYSKSFSPSINSYVYPAALWYYVNTPLKAAAVKKSDKYDNEANWNDVIDNVYKGADEEVKAGTQSIALKDPIQYGVGRIETKIKMEGDKFYDGNGKEVDVTNGFTLKGLLIGGQSTVKYDFTSSLNENLTIYDRDVISDITAMKNTTTSANQTLALETKTDQVIHAALELVNNGNDFVGADGIIPAGGTFYLAVKLDPTTAGNYNKNNMNKIVMQDHVTSLTITIKNGRLIPENQYPEYIKDDDGKPIGIDTDGDGDPDDDYDYDGDGNPDTFIPGPDHGGPGWDTNGDGEVDYPVPVDPDTGEYPDKPNEGEGLGGATNGVPDLSSPSIELGTSVDLEWIQGLILEPII